MRSVSDAVGKSTAGERVLAWSQQLRDGRFDRSFRHRCGGIDRCPATRLEKREFAFAPGGLPRWVPRCALTRKREITGATCGSPVVPLNFSYRQAQSNTPPDW